MRPLWNFFLIIHHIGILDLLKEPGKLETTYVPEGDLHMKKRITFNKPRELGEPTL